VRALEIARRLSHPYTLAYTMFHVGVFHLWRREPELAAERARGAVEVAEEQDYPIWRALGMILEGAAMATLGRVEEGNDRIESGIAEYQGLRTPPVFWPLLLYIKAIGRGLGGRAVDGLQLIEQAIGMVGTDGIDYPGFTLLQGDLQLDLGDVDEAAASFRRAHDAAAALGLRTQELRSATRLARVAQADGLELLRGIYEKFTEGFDTPDLTDARALLDGTRVA